MKILIGNLGQTCNQLWGYIPAICDSIRTGENYIIPFHEPEIGKFPMLLEFKNFKFPLYIKLFHRIFGEKKYVKKLIRLSRMLKIGPEDILMKYKKYSYDAWGNRLSPISNEEANIIRKLLTPAFSITNVVDNIFESLDNKIVVGIHIRRGDYKTWANGKYYYSFDQYSNFCKQFLKTHPNSSISFFLSSNEDIPFDVFKDFDTFSIKLGAIEDLYALSKCNYIIGPPSTFSRLASFMGKVPICIVTSSTDDISYFDVIGDFNHYVSGDYIGFDY